jgi:2-polyprenyl-6-methoxyphenol hydroxylase-like FAD-dependent oxidoreductase
MDVMIIGGGIGGLTTALALHARGVDVHVFEAVRELQPLGVGINLLPHSVRHLAELGLVDDLLGSGIATAALQYYTKRGEMIWDEPRGIAAGYHWPQISIHRGELQMILYNAALRRLGPERLHLGHTLESFTEHDQRVLAQFVNRENGAALGTYSSSLMIAADGIHSKVRACFYPHEGLPKWNGAILWRGVTEGEPFLGGKTMIMAGHEWQKFVCYPISQRHDQEGRSLINWIAEIKYRDPGTFNREDWNRPGNLEDFLPSFKNWDFPWLNIPDLIENALHVFEYPMVDRDPLPQWSVGRTTLLGDAAHPMYPIGSNGASQAILDAVALAKSIEAQGVTPYALLAYEAERRPATEKIVLANRQNGPEQVMAMVEERAPDGFSHLEDVVSRQELEEVVTRYKTLAGFSLDNVNAPIR